MTNTEIAITIIVALITAIFGPVLVEYVKSKFLEKKNKDPLKEAIGINSLVVSKLEEVKDQHKADRIWLCQFHNGGHFYPTGKSIQKFSMVYEILSDRAPSQQHQFQNIPIGLFSKSVHKLADGEYISIKDYTSDEAYGLESFAEINGTKSGYLFPLLTIDNKFIGIVGMDYLDKCELTSDEINDVGLEISSIGTVIMNEYLNKK